MIINEFANKLYVINLASRKDRLEQFTAECVKHGIKNVERFEAHSGVLLDGKVNGHSGCTASHRGILELICHHHWPITFVFEDDMAVCVPDFDRKFHDCMEDLPADWELAYFGGHYSEDPKFRANKHWIRINGMFTTSSYAIKYETARKMAPYISGTGPIDCLYSGLSREKIVSYICDPRIFVQREGHSDILGHSTKNYLSMLDGAHVARLDAKTP